MESSNNQESSSRKIPMTKKEIYQRYLAKDDNHEKYLQKQKAWYEKNKEVLKEKAKIRSRINYAKKGGYDGFTICKSIISKNAMEYY